MRTSNTQDPIPDSTRNKILDSARREFAEFGLAGARVDHIADLAGVNKAMIYYHFKSKDELYRSVIDEFLQSTVRKIRQDLTEDFTFEEFMRAAVDRHAAMIGEHPDVRAIFMRELATADSKYLDRITANIIGSGLPHDVIARLQRSMQVGEFREYDIRQIMTAFMTLSIGFYLLEPLFDRILPVDDRDAFIRDRKKIIVDIFLNGLRAKPA